MATLEDIKLAEDNFYVVVHESVEYAPEEQTYIIDLKPLVDSGIENDMIFVNACIVAMNDEYKNAQCECQPDTWVHPTLPDKLWINDKITIWLT